jgi:hypothetical protein
MAKRRIVTLTVLTVLWLAVANATCERRNGRDDLINLYSLARFRLDECREMGVASLDPVGLQKAVLLREEIADYLETARWEQAEGLIDQLEHTVSQLLEQMKDWDPDNDGLSNYAEFILYGTSWADRDTDGDGYLDGSEILRFQTDPLDHCGVPLGAPLETEVLRDCPVLEKLR